jgi:5-formyltetrahydrofolate cyclo-ligase
MQSQQQIRQQIRQQRRNIEPALMAAHSKKINYHIQHSAEFRNARRIASYIACDGEVSLAATHQRIFNLQKALYLPVLDEIHHNRLWFAPCHPDSRLYNNRYGIPEPGAHSRQHARALGLNLVLTPLVGFDRKGHRLGMGGGYYDKSLAFLQQRKYWLRPFIMGVAYGFQEIKRVNFNEWDIPLHAVATENGIFYFDK